MPCNPQDKTTKIAVYAVLAVGILLTIILVPISLSYIEYNEFGLEIRTTTGAVDTEKVYSGGRYMTGPTYDFLRYPSDAHLEDFEDLSVFSSGGNNESIGLEFILDLDFTYLLRKDELGDLHQELAQSYKAVIASRAKDAIKNEAIFFTFSDYFKERKLVEQRFREAVQRRWDETKVHCDLDQFHLGRIRIPDSVAEKQLESQLQNERNKKESFLQQAQIEREQTDVEVNTIILEKEKVLRTAQAEASLLRAKAEAQAVQLRSQAKVNGTSLLVLAAEIRTQEHMTAFSYIRTLATRDELDIKVSYLNAGDVQPTIAA